MKRMYELKLIEIGLEKLLDEKFGNKKGIKKNKWTEEQRRKFKATMAKKWKEKKS